MIWMAVRYCRIAPEMALTPNAAPSAIRPSPGHDAEAGRHAAEEAALDGALDAEQVDGTKGHRQQHAHDHADRYDQGIGDEVHGGATAISRSCAGARPRAGCADQDGLRAQASAAGVPPAGDTARQQEDLPMRLGVRTSILRRLAIPTGAVLPCPMLWAGVAPSAGRTHRPRKRNRQPKKAAAGAQAGPEIRYGSEPLPGPVQDMREAILGAVRSGRIEELRHAWELNELKPDLGVRCSEAATRSRIGSRSRATARAARSWQRWARSSTPATSCCRSAATSRTTGSTCGPISPRVPLAKLAPAQEVRAAAPRSARRCQGDAGNRQVHPLAARHRRRRHVAFFPQGAVNRAVAATNAAMPRSRSR